MWIEILGRYTISSAVSLSRPARALWIEIKMRAQQAIDTLTSRPARALWIEIYQMGVLRLKICVEAREGLVD